MNKDILWHLGCKFTVEDLEISTVSIHFYLNKLLTLLIKTAFFKVKIRVKPIRINGLCITMEKELVYGMTE